MKLTMFGSTGLTARLQTSEAANSQFLDSSCSNKANHKILVAYATEFGTTREVPEVIGRVIPGRDAIRSWAKDVDSKLVSGVNVGEKRI